MKVYIHAVCGRRHRSGGGFVDVAKHRKGGER